MGAAADSGGILLSFVTESFAVRALLGSLAAAALAALLVGRGLICTSRGRRLVLLAPVLTAAVAAVASLGEAYLPQLWVATGGADGGRLPDLIGGRSRVADHGMDVLVLAYAAVALTLLARRALGVVTVRRLLAQARPVAGDGLVVADTARLASSMGIRPPRVVLLDGCPGGAFTTGARRPVVAVDPDLVDSLDAEELEGLLAHELAHIARRDTAVGGVVGLFRDLAFFLPPLYAAARWLRREQEESADEIASSHTGRPAALASSILKVWDCTRGRPELQGACAAVPGRLAVPSGVLASGPAAAEATRVIAARVERLIIRLPAPSRLRRRAEIGIASAVLALGCVAALTVPSWIATGLDTDSALVYLSALPEVPAESPAFATFRALTPPQEAVAASDRPSPGPAAAGSHEGCPCVESQAQLLRGEAARSRPTPGRLSWGSLDRPAWDVQTDAPVRTTRPLWTPKEAGPQVGVFLVSRPLS